jgi:hypothetical protein
MWSDEESLRSDLRGFSQEQMITCETCLRANPPTRPNCLYCGAVLPQSEARATLLKPTLRPLEKWEQGFNTILVSSDRKFTRDVLAEIADLLRLSAEDVERIMASGESLPLARAATLEEATLVQQRLDTLGVKTLLVTDRELDAFPPKRLRTVDITDDALVVYQTGRQDGERVSWQDIVLLVTGRRIVRRLEVSERSGRKKEKELVDSRELSADELRLDMYANRDESGWRIAADNFDFSCLKERKSLVASQNFQTLKEILRERAKGAEYDESYLRLRYELSAVWPLEQHTESLGVRKQRMGQVNTEAAMTSDNETQFTRYSRLRHYLKLGQSKSKT